tara:strand:+ start:6215 stop:6406 length:192 start_codon:yes stop_codon:yes gene_type:complete
MLEKIEGTHKLRRDTASGAIINVSSEAYNAARIRRKRMSEFEELKGEVGELKNLISQILKKLN